MTYNCEKCGNVLIRHPKTLDLKCPNCGYVNNINAPKILRNLRYRKNKKEYFVR